MLWSRPALLVLSLVLVSAGCAYGNGSPCEAHSDCASGNCCGFAPTFRGVCRPPDDEMCNPMPIDDTGVPEDTGAIDTGVDTGTDAPSDVGSDAPVEDTGIDAPMSDVGTDAPMGDAGDEDTGVDAPG